MSLKLFSFICGASNAIGADSEKRIGRYTFARVLSGTGSIFMRPGDGANLGPFFLYGGFRSENAHQRVTVTSSIAETVVVAFGEEGDHIEGLVAIAGGGVAGNKVQGIIGANGSLANINPLTAGMEFTYSAIDHNTFLQTGDGFSLATAPVMSLVNDFSVRDADASGKAIAWGAGVNDPFFGQFGGKSPAFQFLTIEIGSSVNNDAPVTLFGGIEEDKTPLNLTDQTGTVINQIPVSATSQLFRVNITGLKKLRFWGGGSGSGCTMQFHFQTNGIMNF